MFGATFKLVTRVGLDYCNFWTLKDGSLEITILASNNCFSFRNGFQNGVKALLKMVKKILQRLLPPLHYLQRKNTSGIQKR